jgi:hypothetical protein
MPPPQSFLRPTNPLPDRASTPRIRAPGGLRRPNSPSRGVIRASCPAGRRHPPPRYTSTARRLGGLAARRLGGSAARPPPLSRLHRPHRSPLPVHMVRPDLHPHRIFRQCMPCPALPALPCPGPSHLTGPGQAGPCRGRGGVETPRKWKMTSVLKNWRGVLRFAAELGPKWFTESRGRLRLA